MKNEGVRVIIGCSQNNERDEEKRRSQMEKEGAEE